jgi:signal transduction histidine kinase/ActR/RegA family two-component response regulator
LGRQSWGVRTGIATKLALILIPLLILPFGILGYFWYTKTRAQLEAGVRGELQARLSQFGARLRPFLRERDLDLSDIASSPVIEDYHAQLEYRLREEAEVARKKLVDYLVKFARARGNFVGQVRYLDQKGMEVAGATPEGAHRHLVDRSGLPIFQRAARSAPEGRFPIEVDWSDTLGTQILRLGAPIFNQWKEFRGMVLLDIPMDSIYRMLDEALEGRPGTLSYLIDKDGGILGPPDAREELERRGPRGLKETRRSLDRKDESTQVVELAGGGRGLLVLVALRSKRTQGTEPDWAAGILTPLTEIYAPVAALTRDTTIYGGIACFLLLVTAGLVAQGASRRVRRLQMATAQVAEGNFVLRLPEDARDELGDLARSFNTMAESLARRQAEVEARTAEAQKRQQDLEILNTVILAAHTSLDINESLEAILDSLQVLLKVDVGAVRLLDAATGKLVMAAHRGLNPSYVANPITIRTGEGHMGRALQSGRPMVVRDPKDLAEFKDRVAVGEVGGMVFVPITSQGQGLGVIALGSMSTLDLSEADLDLLASIGLEVGTAIRNARLYADLQAAYEQLKMAQAHAVQVEKLRALGELAAGVAHDFNNMLAAILARAQILQVQIADPQVHKSLQIIEQSALDGAETVRRILGFARARGHESMLPVEVAPLLQQVVEVSQPRWKDEAQARGVGIEVKLKVDPVPAVLGNAAELREVFFNLVLNAVDAMPSGGTITLGARCVGGPGARSTPVGNFVEIYVRDTGTGMPEEVRRRVFDPFFTTKGLRGSGLGLSVAFGIVTRHGGTIDVTSQEGAGTTVMVRLPVASPAAAEASQPASAAPIPSARILVVDDEKTVADSLADMLRLQGHTVEAVTDPRLALTRLEDDALDLVITDLGMPELNGWEVAEQTRSIHPGLPVILVTGWGHQIDPDRLQATGIARVIAKPFRIHEIREAVAAALEPQPAGAAGRNGRPRPPIPS